MNQQLYRSRTPDDLAPSAGYCCTPQSYRPLLWQDNDIHFILSKAARMYLQQLVCHLEESGTLSSSEIRQDHVGHPKHGEALPGCYRSKRFLFKLLDGLQYKESGEHTN